MHNNIKVIAFDADDTLWVNETYFREAEDEFTTLLEDFLPRHVSIKELFKTEIDNLSLYGYGVKAFTLSMLETVLRVTENNIPAAYLGKVIQIGRDMLNKPVIMLPGVETVLQALQPHYRLVVATKGDLLDQERKLRLSGIGHYFHHIEIMSDKQENDYAKLIRRLDIQPGEFLMLGNSLKSDVLPVLALGGFAGHIPFYTTWEHERIDYTITHANFYEFTTITEILSKLLPEQNAVIE
ncbi:HAD family hydrolase [Chitinophaga sp.]|uniref:HAD family hydrolase n=1 Tax=Chitinophaga sp. TaxID=1869181 RepID=UPI0031E2D1FB